MKSAEKFSAFFFFNARLWEVKICKQTFVYDIISGHSRERGGDMAGEREMEHKAVAPVLPKLREIAYRLSQ